MTNLFILSSTIIEAREAAAPISKAIARQMESHLGLLRSKKSITWIVEIIETTTYRRTKVDMTKICTPFFCMILFLIYF
jgi:hypothetical protein